MPASPHIYLPLSFTQLFELAKQLPKKERRQLADLLIHEDSSIAATAEQQQFVLSSIRFHEQHPELLVPEDEVWNMTDPNDE
jgi:hypothetical protein